MNLKKDGVKQIAKKKAAEVKAIQDMEEQQDAIIRDYAENTEHAEEKKTAQSEIEMVTLKVSEKWVGSHFTSKAGQELVEVKIPHADRENKTPWPSFVTDPKKLHNNKFGGGLWMKLPKNGHTTIKQPMRIGTNENGKGIYENQMSRIPNTELKGMIDAVRRTSENRDSQDGHAQQGPQLPQLRPHALLLRFDILVHRGGFAAVMGLPDPLEPPPALRAGGSCPDRKRASETCRRRKRPAHRSEG